MKTILIPVLLLCGLIVGDAVAATLDDAVAELGDGRLYFSYPTREGVYGDGRSVSVRGRWDDDWHCDCDEGPAHVRLRVRDGRVIDVDVRVGGRNGKLDGKDLGLVDSAEAAEFLLRLAEGADQDGVEDAVFAASIAEGFDDWARVIAIARDDRRPSDVREAAIFWLGQAAGREATRELVALVDDDDSELEIREHAIFALSQRDASECLEPLARIARASRHPQLREKALFWLAQHDDPRVVDLFEEILLHD